MTPHLLTRAEAADLLRAWGVSEPGVALDAARQEVKKVGDPYVVTGQRGDLVAVTSLPSTSGYLYIISPRRRVKPHVSLRGYDRTKYTVLVARKSGEVFVAGAYSYKAAAYRLSSLWSPGKDPLTYRALVVRPGDSLLRAVSWLIEGLPEAVKAAAEEERK